MPLTRVQQKRMDGEGISHDDTSGLERHDSLRMRKGCITETEWEQLSRIKNCFNTLSLETYLKSEIERHGTEEFEAFLFKMQFFFETYTAESKKVIQQHGTLAAVAASGSESHESQGYPEGHVSNRGGSIIGQSASAAARSDVDADPSGTRTSLPNVGVGSEDIRVPSNIAVSVVGFTAGSKAKSDVQKRSLEVFSIERPVRSCTLKGKNAYSVSSSLSAGGSQLDNKKTRSSRSGCGTTGRDLVSVDGTSRVTINAEAGTEGADVRAGGALTVSSRDVVFHLRTQHEIAGHGVESGHAGAQSTPGVLMEYQTIAEGLFVAGYYSGILAGIEKCLQTNKSFVILDSPSGTGKTLAGVALSMQGCNNKPNSDFTLVGRTAYVYHLIWPAAVQGQQVYKAICVPLETNSGFFESFARLSSTGDQASLWCFLQSSLPGIETRAIAGGKKVLLLIIDEIPEDPEAVQSIGRLRDALKLLPNVCLLLCGTHSKAANMVGLTQCAASRNSQMEPVPWAWILTRLPRFDLELSGLQTKWDRLLKRDGCEKICNAIKCSISNGGNPLLISLAIKSAVGMQRLSTDSQRAFLSWQREFANEVLNEKFSSGNRRFSHQFKGMIGQLNLLLNATATAHLSDILLGHHFAFRCIPDHGESCGAKKGATIENCGGCLYLAGPQSCVLGNTLIFYRGNSTPASGKGFASWQATCFSPPHKDLLLYLMAFRHSGYLTTTFPLADFGTYELVLPSWRNNSAGLINFQNPNAVRNTGCLFEVLLTAAVKNAAARTIGGIDCSGIDFILQLMEELGLRKLGLENEEFGSDPVLLQIRIPRMLIFTQERQCKEFASMKGILGLAERVKDSDEIDLLVKGVSSDATDSIRIEAKNSADFHNGEMAKAASKLFWNGNRVGVIVVHHCCQYWGRAALNKSNRSRLRDLLHLIPGLRVAYLFSADMEFESIEVSTSPADTGRLLVIQVPECSLRESYPFASADI